MENIQTLLAAVAQTQGFDDDSPPPPSPQISNQIVVSDLDAATPLEAAGEDWPAVEVYPLPLAAVPAAIGEKKKRGRPARGQPPPPKRIKQQQEDEEEDVCFICFDGGSLVLCDRKGCPKAYHPACIKRDEAFFKTKAKWNCGWHICSVCRKNSHYLCYTCTYSLCKGCTKDADYVSVRGNRGFCSTCMKTIMLIENTDQANSDAVKVDFDDKLSWEYLFKVYWVLLKEKLSLTLNELTQARNPWKEVPPVVRRAQSRYVSYTAIDGSGVPIPSRCSEHLELNKPCEEISIAQSDRLMESASCTANHVETVKTEEVDVPGYQNNPEKPSMNGFIANPINDKGAEEPNILRAVEEPNILRAAEEPNISRAVNEPSSEKATDKPGVVDKATDRPSPDKTTDNSGIDETNNKAERERDRENSSITENTNKSCISKNGDGTREKDSGKSGTCSITEWATKDLLEFVAHMKNGDRSPLSQFDVQKLLLDYIKRHNLRDPQRKSQIICDLRLTNLFGRARVGHIEMLKLLEYHFLIQEDSRMDTFIPAGFVGSPEINVDVNNHSLTTVKSRKRKAHKKIEERAPQNDLKEYAAIDFHNINLIYLRRNLMESLIEDRENFSNKVIGSIVRIKISGSDPKTDVHRLVQVVGTSKVTQPYDIGDKTTDIMLEILNLDKKETVAVDSISNQGFTEEECRRLRQSIRCGLMKQFTVGEIQNKAMAIQSVKITGWLEAEILRLNHLRDLASEKGRKKELREYVQKVQLLKSPEERLRRISEVPEVHADPKMSPSYESEEDVKSEGNSKKDEYMMQSHSGISRSERISPNKKGKQEGHMKTMNQTVQKVDANGSHSLQKHMKNQVNMNGQTMQRARFESSAATAPLGNPSSAVHIESEKLWHYRDPNGKIQGPFSMMQLRKWSTTGLFPPDMRIWTNHEQYDSLLLTDAMKGKFHGASDRSQKASSHTVKQAARVRIVRGGGVNVTSGDSKKPGAASSRNAVGLSNGSNRQTNAASTNHAITSSDRDSKLTNAAAFSSHETVMYERDSIQTNAPLSNHGVDSSERDGKKTNAVSSGHGIDLSERDGEQTNAVLSNHGIDLSDRDGEQTDAVLSGHGIDLSERDGEQTNAVSSGHEIDSSKKEDSKQQSHGIDLAMNAALSDHGIDLSTGDGEQMKTVSSGHGTDLSKGDSKQMNAVSSCHGIDLSERDGIQTNVASPNHVIGPSLKDDSSQTNAASSNHAVDLSLRDCNQTTVTVHNCRIDLSERDSAQTNAASSNYAGDLSLRDDNQTNVSLPSHAIDLSERDGKQTNAASFNHSIDLSEREKQKESSSTNHAIDLSDGNSGSVKADETNSPAWPQCWDLLKDSNPIVDNVQVQNVIHSSSLEHTCVVPSEDQESRYLNRDSQNRELSLTEPPTQNQMASKHEVQSQSTNQGQVLLTAEETLRSLSIDLMSPTQDQVASEHEVHGQSTNQGQVLLTAEETLRSLSIDLMSPEMESESVPLPALDSANGVKPEHDLNVADLNNPLPQYEVEINEKQHCISSDARLQTFLELLSPTPKSNDEQVGHTTDGKQSGLLDFPLGNSGPSWTSLVAGAELPDEVGDDWCGYSPTPAKGPVHEWDPDLISASSPTQPPEVTSGNVVGSTPNNNPLTLASPSYPTSWLAMLNEPIEFDALGEESVSDLLAEVDAMESQGGFHSPTSAMKFAKELLQDSKDDCFSSIEDFSSTSHPVKSDAFSSTGEVQLTSQSTGPSNLNGPTPIDFLDTFRRSGAHSSASSEGETNAPALSSSSEFHPPASTHPSQEMAGVQVGPSTGSEMMDPGWGTVQGNINLVTVQGNVNLVLGGHGQGMANLNWGTNPGTPWANPNINRSPINGGNLGLPWDGQRKYEGERFTSPREWPYQGGQPGFGRGGRPPWGRQLYGNGGGYSRPLPKGQRVCKFYESGRCKKGAFCDYLHPS